MFMPPLWSSLRSPEPSVNSSTTPRAGLAGPAAAQNETPVTLSPQGLNQSRQAYGLQGSALARAEQTRDVMLGFVGQRLQQLQREGADAEKIQETLQQAVSGFQTGYSQALEQLNAGGMMNDDLANELEATRVMVLEALQGLANPQPNEPVAKEEAVTAAMARFQASFASQQSAQLSVTTRDGDTVTLTFERNGASQVAAQQGVFTVGGQNASSYQVQVQGELDDEEREALTELLEQVDEVANSFYAGDVQQAFAMATELEMDGDQLAAMSMSLRQTSSFNASAVYESVQGREQGRSNPQQGLAALERVVDSLIVASDKAAKFDRPQSLLSDLLGGRLALTGSDFSEQRRAQMAALLDSLIR